jgi:hypothetical protein
MRDRTNKFADESAPVNGQKKSTKHKTGKSSEQRTQHTQQNQGTQTNGSGY